MQLCKTLAHFAAVTLFSFGTLGQVSFSDSSLPLDELLTEARAQLGDELFDRVSNYLIELSDDDVMDRLHRNGALERRLNSAVWTLSYEDAKAHSNPSAPVLTVPDIATTFRRSVVKVEGRDAAGDTIRSGTGFVIAPGIIATNRHVLKGAASAAVLDADSGEFAVTGLWTLRVDDARWDEPDPDIDLVMLKVPAILGVLDAIPLASRALRVGERVIALGHPLGLGQAVTDGIVSARVRIPSLGYAVQHTAAISPGSSGSPLLNSRGEVVGVATSFIKDGQSLNLAISVDELRALSLGSLITFEDLAGRMSLEEDRRANDSLGLAIKATDPQAKASHMADALKYATSACSLAPDNPFMWDGLALIHRMLFQFDLEAEAILHAIRLQPAPPSIASVKASLEKYGTAASRIDVEISYANSVERIAGRYLELALAQKKTFIDHADLERPLSNASQAIRFVRNAMASVDERREDHLRYLLSKGLEIKGSCQLTLDRPGEALANLQEAATFNRTHRVVARMSDALWELGDRSESIKLAREAVELVDDSEIAIGLVTMKLLYLEDLGRKLAEAGRNSEAKEVVRLMRLIPNGEGLAELLSKRIR